MNLITTDIKSELTELDLIIKKEQLSRNANPLITKSIFAIVLTFIESVESKDDKFKINWIKFALSAKLRKAVIQLMVELAAWTINRRKLRSLKD